MNSRMVRLSAFYFSFRGRIGWAQWLLGCVSLCAGYTGLGIVSALADDYPSTKDLWVAALIVGAVLCLWSATALTLKGLRGLWNGRILRFFFSFEGRIGWGSLLLGCVSICAGYAALLNISSWGRNIWWIHALWMIILTGAGLLALWSAAALTVKRRRGMRSRTRP